MKKLMIGLVSAALLPLSAPVMAKDICISLFGGARTVKFKAVKSLKKPGSVSPLVGTWEWGGDHVPVSGMAVTRADGLVNYGFIVYGMAVYPDSGRIDVVGAAQDLSAASSATDINGDFVEDNTAPITAFDCKLLPKLVAP